MLEGRVFVAHNASFDWGFVSAEFERAHGEQLSGASVCTVRLARRLLSHLPRRNLDAVAAYYEIDITARHRALGDAAATAEVFTRMLDELGRQGVHTWRDFTRYFGRRTKKRKKTAMPHPMFDFRIA
jgi:DNA polymerase-3 subunit epsilon